MKKIEPVTTPPTEKAQLHTFLSLFEIAYIVGKKHRHWLTVFQIAGAIRALKLKSDKQTYTTTVRGGVVYRQQTMVHKHHLNAINDYCFDRYVAKRTVKKEKAA